MRRRVAQAAIGSGELTVDHGRAARLNAALKRTSLDASALRRVPEWLAECGVIVVFSEGLPGGKLDGAVTFLAGPLFGAIGGYAYLLPAGLSLLALGLTLMLARVWNGSTLFATETTP